MGIHRGPNPVKDGLVFGYDTGYGVADNSTTTRFYPGKPTDNEFYNSGPDGTILNYVGYGGTGTAQSGALDALGTTDNIVYRKTGKLRFGPTGGDDIGTLYYGNTYTFSIYMRHVPGETQMSGGEFDINDQTSGGRNYSGTLSSNMTYEWKRFSVTSTHTNNSNYHFIDIGVYQGTGVFEWCCPHIELGTIASPFTSTERSDTASLIDLKRATNIDASNVSFDSTGQPTFDGSNDYITIPGSSGITSDAKTVEIMFKMNGSYSNFSPLAIYADGSSSTNRIWLGLQNNKFRMHGWGTVDPEGATTISADEWYVCTFSYDKSTQAMKVYTNGVLETSTTNTQSGVTASSSLNWYLGTVPGGWQSVTYSDVDIPIFKLYNRILSDSEVKQNYNAYKNRFDI